MPPAEVILSGLTDVANRWLPVAVLWHAYVAGLLLVFAQCHARSARLVAALLVPPLASVSALAWLSQNPFNGTVCGAMSLALLAIARRLPKETLPIPPSSFVFAGGTLLAFGWTYPHFLQTTHPSLYLVAAPLGLLPCPTLSAMIGLTLIVGLRSTAWNLTLAGAALLYGTIGVFHLGVTIDLVLWAGAAALVAEAVRTRSPQPVRT